MRHRILPLLGTVAAILWSGPSHALITPSKLGEFISQSWSVGDARSERVLVRKLREAGLVRPDVADDTLIEVFRDVRIEHFAPRGHSPFDGPPAEKIRVRIEPFLTEKGELWAEPIGPGKPSSQRSRDE